LEGFGASGTHGAAANIKRAVNCTAAHLLDERLTGGLPDARLQPELL
jgi:hypothetical protein